MHGVMDEWLEYSERVLLQMETELRERERAVEAAMATVRNHTQAMEQIERAMLVIQRVIEEIDAKPAQARPQRPPVRPHAQGGQGSAQSSPSSAPLSAQIGSIADQLTQPMHRPEPPPLRPVGSSSGPRRYAAG